MREEERIPEQSDSIQGYGSGSSLKHERYKNESLEGGAIYGAEGGLRIDVFDHDDPDEEIPCICDLPEHSQELLWEDIDSQENAKADT